MQSSIIDRLASQSQSRIESLGRSLTRSLQGHANARGAPEICVYATGSLARREANEASDLDAFFLAAGEPKSNPISKIDEIKIFNSIIETAEYEKFPDFSNDGEYLEFIHIHDLLHYLGDRADDYHNMFTARMLLILESYPIYNEDLYNETLFKVIDRYFTDFHKHNRDFKPIFLLNDILRFWRTLCLNYENGRQWRTDDPMRNAKGHLSNLKLRFSRCNMCFSFVADLLVAGPITDKANVLEVCRRTPLERLRHIRSVQPNLDGYTSMLFQEYEWFLTVVSRPKDEVLDWISSKQNRVEAFSRAEVFSRNLFPMVQYVARKHNYLKYLVI